MVLGVVPPMILVAVSSKRVLAAGVVVVAWLMAGEDASIVAGNTAKTSRHTAHRYVFMVGTTVLVGTVVTVRPRSVTHLFAT